MRITIETETSPETKEQWAFNVFDMTAVFVRWDKWEKPKGKRNYGYVAFWDNYDNRRGCQEPELPEIIRNKVLDELFKKCRVKTWAEWKQ